MSLRWPPRTKATVCLFACLCAGSVLLAPRALSGQTQREMTETANKDYLKADAELKRVYQQIKKGLTSGAKAKLDAAQKLWVKFRDADSDFWAAKYAGGSIQPMARLNRMTTLTKQRISDLKESQQP